MDISRDGSVDECYERLLVFRVIYSFESASCSFAPGVDIPLVDAIIKTSDAKLFFNDSRAVFSSYNAVPLDVVDAWFRVKSVLIKFGSAV